MKNNNKIIFLVAIVLSVLGYLIYHGNDKIDKEIVEIVEVKAEEIACDKNKIKQPVITIESQEALQNLLLQNKNPYILFCHMDNCYWCEKMAPVFEQGAIHKELQAIQFYSVNSQLLQNSDIIQKIVGKDIAGYPYIICMNEGTCINQLEGYYEPEEFENEIKNNFTKI